MIRSFEGKKPQIASTAFIDETALVLGEVSIGEDSSVWPMSVVRGDVNRISIGDRTNVQDNSVLHVTHDGPYTPGGVALLVGDDVTVGHNVILHACTIGNRCLIGMGSIVMDKAVLEDEVFIAAGALVSPGKRLRGGYLYRGNPAVEARPLTQAELDNLRYSAQHYVRLKNRHIRSG
jgi:carbonic anhydrase/acetyltransferase-like protein (isoleucine patch superfamily)